MTKLYYSPGACSLSTRIALHEAGIPAEFENSDLHRSPRPQGGIKKNKPNGFTVQRLAGNFAFFMQLGNHIQTQNVGFAFL